jgi:hypothetical protein
MKPEKGDFPAGDAEYFYLFLENLSFLIIKFYFDGITLRRVGLKKCIRLYNR